MMGMEDTMIAMYEEPEETHALIDFITEAELDYAKTLWIEFRQSRRFCITTTGEALRILSFPEMFDEFHTGI